MILGHESCGIVESVGEGVTKVKAGDTVIPLYMPECGECFFCKSGRTNLCIPIAESQAKGLMPDGTTRFSCKGKPIYHFMGTSSFSEYTVLSQFSVSRIDVVAPADKICLLGCCIPTGYGAVVNSAKVFSGASVAVFGCGALGISVIQGAVAAGASRIFAIDINPDKFKISTEFGATECINPLDYPNQLIEDVIKEKTYGLGVDFSFDTSGGRTDVMISAFNCVAFGWGKACIISLANAGEKVSALPIDMIKGKTWLGTAFGGVKGSQLNEYVQKYVDRKIKIDEYISGYITFDQINEGFESLRKGECIRKVITF
ncbi:Alcohol dehydrogenase class-3 chain L [Smittium culicis]|uniref:Alcohol dehydrogenase class-3 chain L n=1 Tax=Smittium culicis TaxID=133412 RepID=A0A1R1XN30_9FUNG|nr:Alcohol dehydrogenase class-3 chain L [Smittium culicis]